jgi:hypothetical protein
MTPGPRTFHQYRYGFAHVICDTDGRIIASSVNVQAGPLMAAGPALLLALTRIAGIEGEGREVAQRAIEDFGEREAMILADWDPHRSRPRLRIVGEAR